jgi:hypothetical protein
MKEMQIGVIGLGRDGATTATGDIIIGGHVEPGKT